MNQSQDTPSRGIRATVDKETRKGKKDSKRDLRLIRDSKLFRKMKPRKKFVFHSDYFEVDEAFGTIMTILHDTGSDDNLGYFWGIQLIPRNIGNDVSVRRIEHVGRVSESWVAQHQGRAEGLLKNRENEVAREGTMMSRQKLNKEQRQLLDIADDLMNGSSYLRVAMRLLVKAPTLERLDEAVNKINRQYKDQFDTVRAAPYVGEQKREMSSLLAKVDDKMGRNFMFTSAEFAGSYSLVTRGIEDPTGEYIGQMEGDVNSSAVLMDVDKYDSHVVIAGRGEAQTLSKSDFNGQRGVDLLGTKLGVNALLRNRRVVHLVLNRADIASFGQDLSDITSVVDMTRGDINPFEMFGEAKDELSIFPAHVDKLILMVEQLQPMPPDQAPRIKGALREVLNQFYIDQKMWSANAQANRDRLRLVGIPHVDVPRIPKFQAYLNIAYKEQVNARNKDEQVMAAYGFLETAFRDMMSSNGDLFNTTTSDIIDRATVSNRVIYDFSSLIKRGRGLMMAQFVNALSFSVGNLKAGDVVLLHGVEQLHPGIKEYVRDMFDQLHDNGVRAVFIYNSVDKMITDRSFNQFDSADYTLIGGMTKGAIDAYESAMKQEVPKSLRGLLEHSNRYRYYLRRGFDNIVFANDIQMGFEFNADLAE